MINTTDLSECEVSLPGDWVRTDNGDIYSFTTEHMELKDEQLFKGLYIHHPSGGTPEFFRYTMAIIGDYCGILVDEDEFIIRVIDKKEDGSSTMEWEDPVGARILFEKKG